MLQISAAQFDSLAAATESGFMGRLRRFLVTGGYAPASIDPGALDKMVADARGAGLAGQRELAAFALLSLRAEARWPASPIAPEILARAVRKTLGAPRP